MCAEQFRTKINTVNEARRSLTLRRYQVTSGHGWQCWESAYVLTTASLGWWTAPSELGAAATRRLDTGQIPCSCPDPSR